MKVHTLHILCLLSLALGSCRKGGEIKVYTVDKKPEPTPHLPENPHGKSLPPVQLPGNGEASDPHAGMKAPSTVSISDQAPAHWKKKKATAMRMASYEVLGEDGATADISFTTLRSVPGSLLANINRWRGQVANAAWTEEEFKDLAASVPTVFGDATVMDAQGLMEKGDPKNDGRIIGAIAEKDGRAWFYKMRGNAELVGREKDNFLAWVPTVKLLETPQPVPMPMPGPVIEPAPTPAAGGPVAWKLPTGWTENFGGASRHATLGVPGADGGTSEVVVSFFPGDVGGDVANVNRWRRQVGLPALGDEAATKLIQSVTAGDSSLKLVDLKGPQRRMLAAWIRHGEHTWFFKWAAADAVLDAGMKDYLSLLQSVRFNSPE